jgi:hypothetical protein
MRSLFRSRVGCITNEGLLYLYFEVTLYHARLALHSPRREAETCHETWLMASKLRIKASLRPKYENEARVAVPDLGASRAYLLP